MVEENDVRKGKEGDGGRECGAEGKMKDSVEESVVLKGKEECGTEGKRKSGWRRECGAEGKRCRLTERQRKHNRQMTGG